MQPLAASIPLPGDVEISQKLFFFCPSPVPGSPWRATEPRRPSTASGRRSKCRWARGKHFWLFWRPCCFMPCINEFAACSNPSSAFKQTSAFKHKTFFLNSKQWTSAFKSPGPRDRIQNTWSKRNPHHKHSFGFPAYDFFLFLSLRKEELPAVNTWAAVQASVKADTGKKYKMCG